MENDLRAGVFHGQRKSQGPFLTEWRVFQYLDGFVSLAVALAIEIWILYRTPVNTRQDIHNLSWLLFRSQRVAWFMPVYRHMLTGFPPMLR